MSTRQSKLTFITIILMMFMASQRVFSQLRHRYELIIHTKNGTEDITFNINAFSAYIWEPHFTYNNYTYLTNEIQYVNPDDITMPGDTLIDNYGWNSDNIPNNEGPFLGRGFYEIQVARKNATLMVDCYGTEFKYQGLDYTVVYDDSQDKFIDDLTASVVTEINLYDDSGGLQPTKPSNFRCTNITSYGDNPEFEWTRPSQPLNTRLSYAIYRNAGSGYRKISTTASTVFVDSNAEIDKFGNTTYYYAKAKANHSPYSEQSSIVEIKTDIAEKILPKNQPLIHSEKDEIKNSNANIFLFAYPNPANPSTNIVYLVTQPTPVQLAIFNIAGQQIANLVDEYQHPGEYSVKFNDQSLAGGVYLVRLLTKDQQITQKILLLK